MTAFNVYAPRVQETLNAGNAHQHKRVQSVQPVQENAPTCTRERANRSRARTKNILPVCAYKNTLNTLNKAASTRLSSVQGFLNTKNVPRTQMSKPLRQQMPTVAGWIDDLRAAFGAEIIDHAIRAGIDGQQTFHARENGREVGTPITYDANKAVSLSDCIIGPMNPANAPQTEKKGPRHG